MAVGLGVHSGPALGFIEGVVVSCPRSGQIWDSEEMDQAVQELRTLGVEWIQFHPYAGVAKDGRIRTSARTVTWTEGGIRRIQGAGLQTMLKPHLAYWGSFSWRGAITFSSEAAWRRFFDGYTRFILDQARRAEAGGVPVFVVGTELDRTVHREKEWRDLIQKVRSVYAGHLTYAANWDRVHDVPFWDALDGIGVQGYFPLGPRDASDTDIKSGWALVLTDLSALSRRFGVPVVFTEIGYALSRDAAQEPWKAAMESSPKARALRNRLTRIALEELPKYDFVAGVFWWKWIPGWNWFDRDFSMRDEDMKELLDRFWTESSS